MSSMWGKDGRPAGGQRTHPTHLGSPRASQAPRYLPLLGPEWGLQLSSRQKPVLQAGQEGQQVAPLREVQWWPLDAILAHQYERAAVLWGVNVGQ